ncbi:MAG TPA: alpha/beta hydrolase [Bdellovibrionales bacterium]|nr:alpha/beta hydrolase [Bdellovibrionales bacterium]
MKMLFRFLFLLATLSTATGCTSLFYQPTKIEYVDREKMPIKPSDEFFASEDGTRLHGWYFESAQSTRKKCVILQYHGNAQNLSSHFFSLYNGLPRGYDFFSFDYRGYGRSEGTPNATGIAKDGRAALRYVQAKFPDRKIIVFGQSLGGAIALQALADLRGEVEPASVIIDSSFPSYRSAARSTLASHWLTWLFQPVGWLVMSDEYAPKNGIERLKGIPLLFVHGTDDRIVSYKQGQRLLEIAPEPKDFWSIPGGGHIDFMYRDHGVWAKKFYDRLDGICQ